MELSICMIVKNEAGVLERCLRDASVIADELIIVDTGSNDRTKEIAARFTKNIYDFTWIDDFAAARNYSFSKATREYIMWLDADDIIEDKYKAAILELKQTLTPDIDIVMMKYHVGFDVHGIPTFSYNRERIFKQSNHAAWIGEVHEIIPLAGKLQYTDIAICHKKEYRNDADRNLRIFETMLKDGKILDTRQKFYYARELYYHKEYLRAIAMFHVFLQSKDAWVENRINACVDVAHCYFAMQNDEEELKALLQSFAYDIPRAEVVCELGHYFLRARQYTLAAYWYEIALTCKYNEQSGGFQLLDCYGYIPYIQLCVCYDKLLNIERAKHYNAMAGAIKPNEPAYLYNKAYFENLA